MHIHRIRSGKQKQHLKVLLRRSRREGSRVVKDTILNLTSWSAEGLFLLESALRAKRATRRTELEREANFRVANVLAAHAGGDDASLHWRMMCELEPEPRHSL